MQCSLSHMTCKHTRIHQPFKTRATSILTCNSYLMLAANNPVWLRFGVFPIDNVQPKGQLRFLNSQGSCKTLSLLPLSPWHPSPYSCVHSTNSPFYLLTLRKSLHHACDVNRNRSIAYICWKVISVVQSNDCTYLIRIDLLPMKYKNISVCLTHFLTVAPLTYDVTSH